tara:strand:- start:113 stop:862 length:750 start_codon:yes stop_codon:yes gene_type:complete
MVKKYKILNTFVHNVDLNTLNDRIIENINVNKKTIVGNLNINAANLSFENTALKPFNDKSDIIFCDGSGIKLACLLKGYYPIPEKITYNTWFPTLLKKCSIENKKVFVLGSNKEVNDKALNIFRNKYPLLKIKGHHGYFEKNGIENHDVINTINEFEPDILAVGLGMPLQEQWILDNFEKLNAKVFLNGGAFLEWLSGNQIQAPKIISDIGFEWLWRLILAPRKLFKRYIFGNFLFYYRLLTYHNKIKH